VVVVEVDVTAPATREARSTKMKTFPDSFGSQVSILRFLFLAE
jgi:hypothetical protein